MYSAFQSLRMNQFGEWSLMQHMRIDYKSIYQWKIIEHRAKVATFPFKNP